MAIAQLASIARRIDVIRARRPNSCQGNTPFERSSAIREWTDRNLLKRNDPRDLVIENNTPSDGAVAAAILSGDHDQFVVLVRRYRPPLLRVAESRLGRAEWAEDVVQETFLAAYKSLHTYDSQYSFRTWIWTILLNQCRRAFAKHARRQTKSGQEATGQDWEQQLLDPNPSSPLSDAERNDQARRIRQILDELTPQQADSLRLRFFGGLKFQEIADSMGCSLSTAKNRVRQGLLQVAQRLPPGDAPLDSADRSTKSQTTTNSQTESPSGENPT